MKVDYNFKDSILKLRFTFENSDRKEYDTHERKHVIKGRDTCVYYLPEGYNLDELHPDRLALAILLNIYTFIGTRIVLPFKTSKYFNNVVSQRLNITIVNEPERGMTDFQEKPRVRFDHIERVQKSVKETDEELAELEAKIQETVSESELANLEEMVRGSVMDEVLPEPSEEVAEEVVEEVAEEVVEEVAEEIAAEVAEVVEEVAEEVVEEVAEDGVVKDGVAAEEVVKDGVVEDFDEEEEVADGVLDEAADEVVAQPFNVTEVVDKHPALCLSMGVDSACALTLLPKDTVCVFLDRIFPMSGETIYNKDHVYNSLQKVKSKGHQVYMVKTDMEYLRKRRGFVIDIGVGVPAILLSNHLNLRSIGYGYSIHNFTHYGNNKLLVNCTGDFCRFDHPKWNEVVKAAGLFLNFITCGLTEIGTQKVVLKGPYKNMASGCMRGTVGSPCQQCPKCYRKLLLEDLIKYKKVDDARGHYKTLSKSGEHKMSKIFGEFSSGLIMAYAYALRDYKGNDPFLRGVQKRLINENNFNWKNKIKYIEKWFNGSNNRIDPLCMDHLKMKLKELHIPMTF